MNTFRPLIALAAIGLALLLAGCASQAAAPATATAIPPTGTPIPATAAPATATAIAPTGTPIPAATTVPASPTPLAAVQIFLVAPGDSGLAGQPIGCGDLLVPATLTPSSAEGLEGAIEALLAEPGEGQLQNFVRGPGLRLEAVERDGDNVTVRLAGEIVRAGVCDDPRVEGQLTATVAHYAPQARILIDGKPLAEYLREGNTGVPAPPVGDPGQISGQLGYPSEIIPPLDIYAVRVDDPAFFYTIRTTMNQSSYSIAVAPGSYYLLANLADSPPDTISGAYTAAVLCGHQIGCDDHTLLAVDVAPGQIVEEIAITDWYAPPGFFPPRPQGQPQPAP